VFRESKIPGNESPGEVKNTLRREKRGIGKIRE